MIRYYLEACCGFAEYEAELDIEKVRKEFDRKVEFSNKYLSPLPTMFNVLLSYAIDSGRERTNISPMASDYDPYLTEVYINQEDYSKLIEEFPGEDFTDIQIE